jgi:hypothetical protein
LPSTVIRFRTVERSYYPLGETTSEPVLPQSLKTYQDALAQYHLHPEAKFHDGDYLDSGVTRRRHSVGTVPEYIGKGANRWEEQTYLGLDLEAQTEYGSAPGEYERTFEIVRLAGKMFRQRKLAKASRISISEVSAVLLGNRQPNPVTLSKLYTAVSRSEREARKQGRQVREVLVLHRSFTDG